MAPPASPSAPEQRLLAAIVFTDVVSFSARMQEDETGTLRHLERDFITMREFAGMHGGNVIKTTGDGLLLCFTSAVQAVEWALRTQRHFAEQARTYPANEVLRHRVGIHLGDVFAKGDDVMGDGVNIAARVQSEAPTGGICISQTVYDVVKNKAKLHAIRLEPRKLKNIAEAVQMYHLLLEPPQAAAAPTTAPPVERTPPPREEPPPASSWTKLAIGGAVLAGLGIAGVLLVRAHLRHERELAESKSAHQQLGAALQSEAAAPAKSERPRVAAGGGAEEFDFAQLAGDRPPPSPRSPADERALQQARESIRVLDTWVATGLTRFTRDQPLLVRRLRNPSLGDLTVFSGPDRLLYFAEGGATRKRSWPDLPPDVQGAIMLALLRTPGAAPSREIVRGAEAFAYLNGQGEMGRALVRERRGNAP